MTPEEQQKAGLEELRERLAQVEARIGQLNAEFPSQRFPEAARSEWDEINTEREQLMEVIDELEIREARVAELANRPANVERIGDFGTTRVRHESIYDLAAIRRSASSPEEESQQLHDNAMRALEKAQFPHERANREDTQEHIEKLLGLDRMQSPVARRVLITGNPNYGPAFGRAVEAALFGLGGILSDADSRLLGQAVALERALSLGTTGIPIPYVLDPTLVPVSNGSVNPWRFICRVEQITGANEWRGATSGAISAAYVAEGTEATDASPTLAQPVIPAVRAQAFVPFSIEAGMDWPSLQGEMATGIAEAKDDLEAGATGFFGGNGTNQPTGLNALPTAANVLTAAIATFAVGDLFLLEQGLPPRFRSRARIVGNRAQFNRVRQFNVGDNIWVPLGAGLANNVPTPGALAQGLLGYETFEASGMVDTVTAGSRILLMGDFRYYVIVERVGMNLDLVPHLFGATNRFPTGQRGLYAFWRNGGEPIDLTNGAGFKFLRSRTT